jgi:peptidoglycan-associated lipoprotein
MKNLITALLSVALIVFITGCGKKPKVEQQTKPTTGETGKINPADTSKQGQTGTLSEKSSRFATVYFDFDRYNLRDDAKADLKANVEILKSESTLKILIEGHCDERGTVEYNLALGERRAKSVRDYMTSLGIKPDRLSIISYGKERPAEMGHDEDAWAKNRRADFVEK